MIILIGLISQLTKHPICNWYLTDDYLLYDNILQDIAMAQTSNIVDKVVVKHWQVLPQIWQTTSDICKQATLDKYLQNCFCGSYRAGSCRFRFVKNEDVVIWVRAQLKLERGLCNAFYQPIFEFGCNCQKLSKILICWIKEALPNININKY